MHEQTEYEAFIRGETPTFRNDFGAGLGVLQVHDLTEYTVGVTWGGWNWQATGKDHHQALRRLQDRLSSRNPFDGEDSDWGDPGTQDDVLDDSIPDDIKQLMREVTQKRGDVIPGDPGPA